MKTEMLREMGLTQEQIDTIMAENGKDINNAKGKSEASLQEIEGLKSQLADRDNQLNELKKSAKDNEGLLQQITDLQNANKASETEYANKLALMEKNHAIENTIRDAKGKNVKAVMANLDLDKITLTDGKLNGLEEQLESLKKGEDTSFLFGEDAKAPSGSKPSNPDSNTGKQAPTNTGLQGAIANAISKQ